jgi:hypothetical protein
MIASGAPDSANAEYRDIEYLHREFLETGQIIIDFPAGHTPMVIDPFSSFVIYEFVSDRT